MGASTPVSKDSPLWRAWEAYTRTEDYANAERWAVHPEHAKGSLWDAFVHGFNATPTPARSEAAGGEELFVPSEAEGDVAQLHAMLTDMIGHAQNERPLYLRHDEAHEWRDARAAFARIVRERDDLRQQPVAAREDVIDAEARAQDMGAHVAGLLDRIHALEDALNDAIEAVGTAHKGSIGSIDSHYLPQVRVERVGQWRKAAARSEPSGEDPTC